MFWDKGYTPSQNIEALLEKENAKVEEFLEDDDILQECKTQKAIVQYFTRTDVIKRLVELITTEPSEELPVLQRFRHASMASEILTLGLPSLCEKLLSDADTLNALYSYLKNEPPLNPLLSSFFSKTFCMLFTKKSEQDWFLYQKMCLEFLEYIKSQNDFLDLVCKHFAMPIIPDLVMHMMKDVEGGQLKRNLYEWLTQEKLVERLIAILADPQESIKHNCVAEFLCDLIQQGRNMRQTEQEIDSFEPAFEGSNPILKTIESENTINALLNVILEPDALDSAIISGISVVLTLIKPVVFVDEPNSDRMKFIHNREKEIHSDILATVIRVIAPHLKDFNDLLSLPPNKPEIITTAATLSPPFGKTRLQICKLFTVLLQTHNEVISKAICETDFFDTILLLFKQYSWNNFLHSEVEKCVQTIFQQNASNVYSNNTSVQESTAGNDAATSSGDAKYSEFLFDKNFLETFREMLGNAHYNRDCDKNKDNEPTAEIAAEAETAADAAALPETSTAAAAECETGVEAMELTAAGTAVADETQLHKDDTAAAAETKVATETENETDVETAVTDTKSADAAKSLPTANGNSKNDLTLASSMLQVHVVKNCKMISKFIALWQDNKIAETAEKGRRLGYMGHLINILKHITNSLSESEHIRALIENYLAESSELEMWQTIVNSVDGELTLTLAQQNHQLANCNAHESGFYNQQSQREYYTESSTWEYIMSSHLLNNLGELDDPSTNDIDDLNLFQYGRDLVEDDTFENENEENNGTFGADDGGGDCISIPNTSSQPINVNSSKFSRIPMTGSDGWDPFSDITVGTDNSTSSWGAALDTGNSVNFADFESHFNTFVSDLGDSLDEVGSADNKIKDAESKLVNSEAGYDNNANVEKVTPVLLAAATTTAVSDDAKALEEKEQSSATTPLPLAFKRNFRSVMQNEYSDEDSDDDDTEDEGVWTKPLGATSPKTDGESMILSNGPSSTTAKSSHNNCFITTDNKDVTATSNTNSTVDPDPDDYDDANDVVIANADDSSSAKELRQTVAVVKKLNLDENSTIATAATAAATMI